LKNLLLIICSFFILVGCAPKSKVVVPNKQTTTTQETTTSTNMGTQISEEYGDSTDIVGDGTNKIAVIYPSKIVSKYAKSTINTITAYLIYNNEKFEIEAFDTYNENKENIEKEIEKLKEKKFTKVIALFTENGFDVLNSEYNISDLKIYFPLINKKEVSSAASNFIFGGISYENQMSLLKNYATDKSTMFYVESYIGNRLKSYYENIFSNNMIIKEIERQNNRYKPIMNDKKIVGSSVVLNTPIIKSAIIMSQLTAYEVNPSIILSTQLNYNPLLMKLTQRKDRTNFFVVNSIGKVNSFLTDYTETLDADITYNWVDYSSLVGVDYLLGINKLDKKEFLAGADEEASSEEKIRVENNQVIYKPVLYKGTSYGFEKAIQTKEN
jgi:uncharacterized protein YcfL